VEIDCSDDKISRDYIDMEKEKQRELNEYISNLKESSNTHIVSFSEVIKERVKGTTIESYLKELYERME
jgi:hypothetical protein